MSDDTIMPAETDAGELAPIEPDPLTRDYAEFVEAPAMRASMSAIGNVNAEALEASFSAIATAKSGMLNTTASAIALSQVDGDASFKLSSTPIVYTKGNAALNWSYASAFVAGGTVELEKSAAVAIAGRDVTVSSGGAAVMAAGKANVDRGFVGVLLAGKTDLGEGARVFIGTGAALIIAAAILGGFGLLAVALYYGAIRLSRWRPTWPDLSQLQLPPLSQFIKRG